MNLLNSKIGGFMNENNCYFIQQRCVIFIQSQSNQFRLQMGQTSGNISTEYESAKKTISDNFNYIDSSVKYYGMAVAVGVSVYIFRNEIEHFFEKYTGSQYFKRKHGANYILEPIEIDEEPHYVERKEIEERLNQIIGNLNERKYAIIVGCKGSGKSTV